MKNQHRLFKLWFAGMIIAFSANAQTIHYVSSGATGANNGTSWANAFVSIQSALEVSTNGDQIWVAGGKYSPSRDINNNPNPTDTRTKTFLIRNGVSLYGGFSGSETSLSQRNILANRPTVLSGDLNGNDNGNLINYEENSYHVLVANALTVSTLVDGFTISGGNATNVPGPAEFLGTVIGHRGGGGLFANLGGNYLNVRNCIITRNKGEFGAGLFLFGSNMKISNCVINENTGLYGGGLMAENSSGPQILNTVISHNAANYGAAIHSNGYTHFGSTFNIINCSIVGNQANVAGAALSVFNGASPETLPIIKNSIIWSNNSPQSPAFFITGNDIPLVSHSNIQGGYPGTGNIDANPAFFDEADLNGIDDIWRTLDDGLHLRQTSSSANSADNGSVPQGTAPDITGAPRIQNEIVNMGAYETLSTPSTIRLTSPQGNGNYFGYDYLDVTWQSTNIDLVKVEYMLNNDEEWVTIPGSYGPNSSVKLSLPNVYTQGCYVRVSDFNDPGNFAQSTIPVSITPLELDITSPASSINLYPRMKFIISWRSNKPSNAYFIQYSLDGGTTWNTIHDSSSNLPTNLYEWTVPNVTSSNSLLKVATYNRSPESLESVSRSFSIRDINQQKDLRSPDDL